MKPESQKEQILKYLQSGRSITPLAALEKFGCFRLAARCLELKKDGHDIVNIGEERNGKVYARYLLKVNNV